MKIEDIENNISEIIKKIGFEIEYIEYVKEGTDRVLRVVIDKLDSTDVSIDDCELISKSIEDIVDKCISNDEKYVLEVSSAGLERQLKTIKLYKKYKGRKIHIKLYKKTQLGKEFDCILKDIDESSKNVTVILDDKEVVISLSEIASAHTIYDYKKLFKNK